MARDIKFTQNSKDEWDISFANGDFEMISGLDTALYMSLFCEKRASESQVSVPSLRRGHFTNEFNDVSDYQIGSLFWLYTSQSRNTDKNLTLLQDAVQEGLSWMITDGIISKTEVTASRLNNGITLQINLINQLNQSSAYYDLFVNTPS